MSRLRDKGLRAALSALIAWLLALGLGLPLLKGFAWEGQMLRFAVCTAGLSGVFSLLRTRKYLFSMSLLLAPPGGRPCIICWAAAGTKRSETPGSHCDASARGGRCAAAVWRYDRLAADAVLRLAGHCVGFAR